MKTYRSKIVRDKCNCSIPKRDPEKILKKCRGARRGTNVMEKIDDTSEWLQDETDPRVLSCEIEEWRPIIIDKLKTSYQISNFGRIKLLNGQISLGGDKYSPNGLKRYTIFCLHINRDLKLSKPVHVLVFAMFLPSQYSQYSIINHMDNDSCNNRLNNLNSVKHKGNAEHFQLWRTWKSQNPNGDLNDFVKKYKDILEKQ